MSWYFPTNYLRKRTRRSLYKKNLAHLETHLNRWGYKYRSVLKPELQETSDGRDLIYVLFTLNPSGETVLSVLFQKRLKLRLSGQLSYYKYLNINFYEPVFVALVISYSSII